MSFVRRIASQTLRAAFSILPPQLRNDVFRVAYQHATPEYAQAQGLATTEGALKVAKGAGFEPRAIVDVGAYIGEWGNAAHRIFPDARLFMVDGNPENQEALHRAQLAIGSSAKYFIQLLGAQAREKVTLFQLASGTSVMRELTNLESKQIDVPMGTLDSLLEPERVDPPVLLKLDVQGFELEVLRGGRAMLDKAELVFLELATIPYNEGAPLFAEVVAFMANAGFLVFDFGGQFRRQTDHTLFQIDVVFARENSVLRGKRRFYLCEADPL